MEQACLEERNNELVTEITGKNRKVSALYHVFVVICIAFYVNEMGSTYSMYGKCMHNIVVKSVKGRDVDKEILRT
jgi:hypothetical protein